MLERVTILLFALSGGFCLWQFWRYYQSKQLARMAIAKIPEELQRLLPMGPTILYFSGAHCAQCRLQQTPILTQLVEALKISVHTVDAVEEEKLATFYGVMTLPTTVILDNRHTPKAINHGVATLNQLRQQIDEVLIQ